MRRPVIYTLLGIVFLLLMYLPLLVRIRGAFLFFYWSLIPLTLIVLLVAGDFFWDTEG